jgi:hypothetical protein
MQTKAKCKLHICSNTLLSILETGEGRQHLVQFLSTDQFQLSWNLFRTTIGISFVQLTEPSINYF